MANAAHTIWLKGEGHVKEAVAAAAITPGHLIQRTSANAYQKHGTAEGDAFPIFAMEQDYVGSDIDTAYASGDRVSALYCEKGTEVYALLPAAAAAVVIGDELVSNGDGTLKKVTSAAVAVGNLRRVVALALEAVDNSGGGAAVRIRVEAV
jgi:hypothetical protein